MIPLLYFLAIIAGQNHVACPKCSRFYEDHSHPGEAQGSLWRRHRLEVLKQSKALLKELQKAVPSVQELELEFSTSLGFEEALDYLAVFGIDDLDSEIRECAGCLQDGRLKDSLAAAPNLKRLDLKFDLAILNEIRGCPADLSYVIGKHKWEFLADVTLSFLSSRAEDLIGFCETHAMTLEKLAISKIILIEDSWLSKFQ